MKAPDITLKQAKEQVKVRNHRVSDFLSGEQMSEIHANNAKVSQKRRKFNQVDAFIAEILSRFGWEVYQAWKSELISQDQIVRYIEAERARDARERLRLENLIVAAVAGANHPTKNGSAPKTLKAAFEILKNDSKEAKGEI